MKRYYSFAGVGLAFDLPDGEEFSEGRELPVFACEPRAGMTEVTVRIADRLIIPEGNVRASFPNMIEYGFGDAVVRCFGALVTGVENAGIISEYREGSINITLKRAVYGKITASAILEALGTERLVGAAGGAILHSSFIDVGGGGGAVHRTFRDGKVHSGGIMARAPRGSCGKRRQVGSADS